MGDEVDDYYRELPDGTIKQRNPFTGTQVWTVPGRARRQSASPHARRPNLGVRVLRRPVPADAAGEGASRRRPGVFCPFLF